MSWIGMVSYEAAGGRLRALYDRIKGPDDRVDNILAVHSLRPHTLEGHMALYKNVLHHTRNVLPTWLLEVAGIYVSLLNHCDYCVDHHFEGLRRLLGDDPRAGALRAILEAAARAGGEPDRALLAALSGAPSDDPWWTGLPTVLPPLLAYATTLTRRPGEVREAHLDDLRQAGLDDGTILELNQVVSYFAYANRTVLGLGVTTRGDALGLSPSSGDSDDWQHR